MKTDQFSGSYPTQRGKRLKLRSLSNGKLLKQLPINNKWIGNTNEYGRQFNKLGHAKITPLFIFIYLFDLAINLVHGPAIFAFSNYRTQIKVKTKPDKLNCLLRVHVF